MRKFIFQNLTRRRGERGGQAVSSSYALCLKSCNVVENISAPSASPREEQEGTRNEES